MVAVDLLHCNSLLTEGLPSFLKIDLSLIEIRFEVLGLDVGLRSAFSVCSYFILFL